MPSPEMFKGSCALMDVSKPAGHLKKDKKTMQVIRYGTIFILRNPPAKDHMLNKLINIKVRFNFFFFGQKLFGFQ